MFQGPLAEYRARLQVGDIRRDPAQALAAEKLESLHKALSGYEPPTGRAGWKERFGLGAENGLARDGKLHLGLRVIIRSGYDISTDFGSVLRGNFNIASAGRGQSLRRCRWLV